MAYGNYSNPTWSNGVSVLNQGAMQAITDQVYIHDNIHKNFNLLEYLDYNWFHNQKIVDYCNTGFTAYDAGTANVGGDATYSFITNQSYRCTCNTHTTGVYCGIQKTISMDLTKFESTQFASSTDDYILFTYYVSDFTKMDKITLKLGTNNSNCYYIDVTGVYNSTGWNTSRAKKSEFSNGGTPPSWSSITWMMIEFKVKTSVDGYSHFVSLDLVSMVRKHPSKNESALFQEYNGTSFSIFNNFDEYGYGIAQVTDTVSTPSLNKPALTILSKVSDIYFMRLTGYWRDFYCKAVMTFKSNGYSAGISWYFNDDNYIATYVNNNIFYMVVRSEGSSTTYSISCGTNAKDLRFILKMWKKNGFIHAQFSNVVVGHFFLDAPDPFTSKYAYIYLSATDANSPGHYHQIEISQDAAIFAETGYSST